MERVSLRIPNPDKHAVFTRDELRDCLSTLLDAEAAFEPRHVITCEKRRESIHQRDGLCRDLTECDDSIAVVCGFRHVVVNHCAERGLILRRFPEVQDFVESAIP